LIFFSAISAAIRSIGVAGATATTSGVMISPTVRLAHVVDPADGRQPDGARFLPTSVQQDGLVLKHATVCFADA
jgi:hypothetical protein